MLEAARCVVAFLVADQADRPAAETPETADDRRVLGELAVAGERREIVEEALGIVDEMRPVGMAGDLRFLPGGQPLIDVGERLGGLRLELGDLLADRHRVALGAERAQLLDLALEVVDRLFEVEECKHPDLYADGRGDGAPAKRAETDRAAARCQASRWRPMANIGTPLVKAC